MSGIKTCQAGMWNLRYSNDAFKQTNALTVPISLEFKGKKESAELLTPAGQRLAALGQLRNLGRQKSDFTASSVPPPTHIEERKIEQEVAVLSQGLDAIAAAAKANPTADKNITVVDCPGATVLVQSSDWLNSVFVKPESEKEWYMAF